MSRRDPEWTTTEDPGILQEFSVECTEEGCGAEFDMKGGEALVERWKCRHMDRTGHRRFWETWGRATILAPPPGAVVASQIVGHRAP
ncbi:hypothetical protein H340_01114 [Streptomyces mobaraensis NBRC 13819 = DSM 40847]|uniref:DUF7848 domain-containing protein n=1 Tax=Streptomyces mobaraensis (strain ATCC 29032 / DSM 40847 / JCM 4168 / NBRC 13819 / NCIMB 11159 / IPCR 16-22) TaxID=1223523 RepID=M3B8S2_STRM1|nr:hypothetical protein [Streptomyces mobaraensis]EMF02403.1 hypothetical protein H340_01114 [Streptomyces mobaraensis NBRC 13819 = DSM 40847]